jgi:hypothetical protein
MKFMDILKEEDEIKSVSDKKRKNTRAVYKALQVGTYKPYPDSNKLKYILPDLEDNMIHIPITKESKPVIFLNFNDVKMYIITSGGDLVDARRIGPDDSAVVRNIRSRIMIKFIKHNINILEY